MIASTGLHCTRGDERAFELSPYSRDSSTAEAQMVSTGETSLSVVGEEGEAGGSDGDKDISQDLAGEVTGLDNGELGGRLSSCLARAEGLMPAACSSTCAIPGRESSSGVFTVLCWGDALVKLVVEDDRRSGDTDGCGELSKSINVGRSFLFLFVGGIAETLISPLIDPTGTVSSRRVG
jgi:hypothetical protein